MTRIADAPRRLVFGDYADLELIPQWRGPSRCAELVDKVELRPGGAWRYFQRDANCSVFGFRGVRHDTALPERLVSTFEFESMPGHALLETTMFAEVEGKNRLVDSSVIPSVDDREAVLPSGMKGGAVGAMERLVMFLATPET